MTVKIRLARIGSKKRPVYRIVAQNEQVQRNGTVLEVLGLYNPLVKPPKFEIKRDRLEWWQSKGAQVSQAISKLISSPL